jgi:16S rRNA (uracil1498-N3)-methyltransferase
MAEVPDAARLYRARIHVAQGLGSGASIAIAPAAAHHLGTVLRLPPGAPVAAFNGIEGEWLCTIAAYDRQGARLAVERRLRPPPAEPDLWLLFAPIRRGRLDWLVEKACELGVSTLVPVVTARTQGERLHPGRLRALSIAAAEQSGRLSLPVIEPMVPLARVLAAWSPARPLLLCDESGAGSPAAAAFGALAPGPAAILVGPEGGFTQTELDALGKLSFVTRIDLGPLVLRAETAAVAALAVFQAVAGEWAAAGDRRRTAPR